MARTAGRIVGIDLGTTHTVVAWTTPASGATPKLFDVPQLVGPAEIAPRRLLPSNLYAPLPDEQLADPWGDAPWVVGEHARRRGGEVPGRAIGSAKSWLCHAAVDRTAPILPWRAEAEEQDELPRLSPVEASTRLLAHVRRTWDESFPDHPLGEQDVVLTVPASFDAVARALTVSAATAAGLRVRLLEEPQAAFYDFMQRGGAAALEQTLPSGEAADTSTVLVCDVGGGTTDLSLIRVARASAEASFEVERVAVGRHLLLGGDNMDLALGHLCERRLVGESEQLDAPRFAQLVLACRVAKERLLSEPGLAELPITLVRPGAKLVGGTLRTSLGRDEVRATVLDGFFPEIALGAARPAPRAGIVAFGLPYERDVGISRHLGAFLGRQLGAVRPTALLLNGGVIRASAIVERLTSIVRAWLATEAGAARLELLPVSDPDVTVARGAVAYGLALRGLGTRIGGGSARGYYLGIGHQAERQTPLGLCVLPRGAAEAARYRASERVLALTVGRPVRFELYATESGAADEVGSLVEIDPQRFERLPPVVTTLPSSEGAEAAPVEVELEAELSAIGTLDLGCVEVASVASPRRFSLAFELRADPGGAERRSVAPAGAAGAGRGLHGYGKRFDEACQALDRVFGKERADVPEREVKGLVRTLEKVLGPRPSWTTELTRALYDVLWSAERARRRSADHERVFFALGGFCLRPGFGDPRDPERVAALAKLFEQSLGFPKEARSWPQFWIAWRRVAAGLDDARQLRIRDSVDPFLAPSEVQLKKPKLFRNDAVHDMLDLAGCLERVPAARRRELGGWVLERTWTDRDPRLWAAIGRIGARVPAYGSVHQVVPVSAVERWLDHMLRERWEEIPTTPRAALSMCRVTGDRARDVSPALRREVGERLAKLGAPEAWQRAVRELVAETEEDRVAFYGEDLPVGLRLVEAGG